MTNPAKVLYSNNAQSTLAGSISSGSTSLSVQAGAGAEFPSPTANEYFVASLFDAATGLVTEIIHVTARSADTFTIVRAQEGTAAAAWNAGDIIGNFNTAGTMQALMQQADLQAQSATYVADSGSVNSIVATFSPALVAYITGAPFRVKIANTTTSTSVAANFNGLGSKTVLRADGSAPAPGELIAGDIVTFVYDGTNLQFVPPSRRGTGAVVGEARNLSGSSQTNTTALWTADELVAENARGGLSFKGASLTFNFNGATTGTNGMDTGSLPTSGDLYVYAIYNPSTNTWACLGTIAGSGANIYGGANMPAGYTASALIWAGKTDGSAHIKGFSQTGRKIAIASASAVSGGSATVFTLVSISSIVPVPTQTISGNGATSANTVACIIADDSSGNGRQVGGSNAGGQTDMVFTDAKCISQGFYYAVSNPGTVDITVTSYRI